MEEEIGRFKYLFLYLASGLAGNVLSAAMDLKTGELSYPQVRQETFCVIGALLIVVAKISRAFKNAEMQRNHGCSCSLYDGFTSTGVDRWRISEVWQRKFYLRFVSETSE